MKQPSPANVVEVFMIATILWFAIEADVLSTERPPTLRVAMILASAGTIGLAGWRLLQSLRA